MIHHPKQAVGVSTLTFDDARINSQRQHGVTEAEAKGFIENAAVSVTRWKGEREHYYSHDGAVYVDTTRNEIRTAFRKEQFDPTVQAIMEVLEKNGK